jgi:hypothetical protein
VPAVAVKLAVVAPDGTVTEDGTLRAELLSETATEAPPVGATLDSVTAQLEVAPDAIVAGAHCSDETFTVVGGVTVNEAVLELPFSDAVTVTA